MTNEEVAKILEELLWHLRVCPAKSANDYRNAIREAMKMLQERPKERCECCEDGRTFVGHSRIFCSDNKFHKVNYCLNCGASMAGADMRESEQE